jgi:cytochrome c peroxidase
MFLTGAHRGANPVGRCRQYRVAARRDDSSAENARLPRSGYWRPADAIHHPAARDGCRPERDHFNLQPNGDTQTSSNAFFQNLGTNGRTCFTCHQTQTGWSVSAQSVKDRFNASSGTDPIFRLVDGATCPTADISTLQNKLQAYSLLLSKGLIRIGLPIPANTEFQVSAVSDPYNCNTNPATGLLSPTSGIVSIYRRPLPSTNLGFLSAIMWDGREPSLFSQSVDATLGHAQANASPSAAQQQ